MPSYDLERDLIILEAFASQIEQYLREDELFWPVFGRVRGGMPRLTIGGFLLRQHRLVALREALSDSQQHLLSEIQTTFDTVRAEWSMHYDAKLAREWEMRANLLRNYLRDCDEAEAEGSNRHCGEYWPIAAEHRTMLQHLTDEAERRHTLTRTQHDALSHIDRGLRHYLVFDVQNAFLWPPELEPAYPRDPYWWLWVVPRNEAAHHEDD